MIFCTALDLNTGVGSGPGLDHERESDQDCEPTQVTGCWLKQICGVISSRQEGLENIKTDRTGEECGDVKDKKVIRGTDFITVLVLVENQTS